MDQFLSGISNDRRTIVRFDVTRYPTAGWLARQVTDAFPWDTAPRYLLRDRDTSFGQEFRKQVDAMNHRGCQRGSITVAECIRRTRDRFASP
jgi:hypothetical protein